MHLQGADRLVLTGWLSCEGQDSRHSALAASSVPCHARLAPLHAPGNACAPVLPPPLLQLLPRVKEIGSDSNQLVRSALATVVMELAPILGKVRGCRVEGELTGAMSATSVAEISFSSVLKATCRLCRVKLGRPMPAVWGTCHAGDAASLQSTQCCRCTGLGCHACSCHGMPPPRGCCLSAGRHGGAAAAALPQLAQG